MLLLYCLCKHTQCVRRKSVSHDMIFLCVALQTHECRRRRRHRQRHDERCFSRLFTPTSSHSISLHLGG